MTTLARMIRSTEAPYPRWRFGPDNYPLIAGETVEFRGHADDGSGRVIVRARVEGAASVWVPGDAVEVLEDANDESSPGTSRRGPEPQVLRGPEI